LNFEKARWIFASRGQSERRLLEKRNLLEGICRPCEVDDLSNEAPTSSVSQHHTKKARPLTMNWTTPNFVEIKMDAEISSYQEEFDPLRDGPVFADSREIITAQSECTEA